MFSQRFPGRGRRCRPAVETLEQRDLPSGIPFNFILDDPNHQLDAFPLLLPDLQAAGQVLSGALQGQGSLEVRVRPDSNVPRSSGSTVAVTTLGTQNGLTLVENGPITEARTGIDPNGAAADIDLVFNPDYLRQQVWFDPTGAARAGDLPADKLDFISIATHEIVHALGFQGYRAIDGAGYGQFTANTESSYDAYTAFGAGGDAATLYFTGAHAEAVYGGPVPLTSVGPSDPLTSQNFYHVGNPVGHPGSGLTPDLMNGMVFQYGQRYLPSALDLAILADLGWNLPGTGTPLPPPPAPSPGLTGDVTTQTLLLLGPRRYNARLQRYQQAVFLINAGGNVFLGPLSVVLDGVARGVSLRPLTGGVKASSARGRIVNQVFVSRLAPGESVVFVLEWGPTTGRRVSFLMHLLAGIALPDEQKRLRH
jgi:hypothetical protein